MKNQVKTMRMMENAANSNRTPDQMFNCVVSLAEGVMDLPSRTAQTVLMEVLEPVARSVRSILGRFKESQKDCPDYFFYKDFDYRFMLERIRLFAKCYDRSMGTEPEERNARRRIVASLPSEEGPVREVCVLVQQLEEELREIKQLLAKPSNEALLRLYDRMDMAVNMKEYLKEDVFAERDAWFAQYKKGRPSEERLFQKRQELLREISDTPYLKLAGVLAEGYESAEELHTAIARCYYTQYRDREDADLYDFMEFAYRYESYVEFDAEGAEGQPTLRRVDEIEGLEEMLEALDDAPGCLADGFDTESVRQLFTALLRDGGGHAFLTSGKTYKGLSLPAFCHVVGLMLSHMIFDASQSDLAKLFFEGRPDVRGMLLVNTARKYIGDGMLFDRDGLDELKPTVETAIKMVKKSRVEVV